MGKADRVITEDEMEFLRIHCDLPYKVISSKKDGKWFIERVKRYLIPIDRLQNLAMLQGNLPDNQFQQAYDEAVKVVTPYKDDNIEEQLQRIIYVLANRADHVAPGETVPEYFNTPFWYLCKAEASDLGAAKTVGLCLDILGIPYELIQEPNSSKCWCCVNINGVSWVCDAQREFCAPKSSSL